MNKNGSVIASLEGPEGSRYSLTVVTDEGGEYPELHHSVVFTTGKKIAFRFHFPASIPAMREFATALLTELDGE
jgi:hypothetical protein